MSSQFQTPALPLVERTADQAFLDEKRADNRKTVFFHACGILIAILLWWACSFSLSKEFRGFAPVPTLEALGGLVGTSMFWHSVLDTMARLLGGLAVSILVGVPTGILIGYFRRASELTQTLFQFLRMISPLSWMPIAIILFGVGAAPVYFLVAIAAVWPIIINTAHGVEKVDQTWIKVAQTLGGKGWGIVLRVLIPAIMPDILTGIRLALGVAWIVIVPAEMLGVASGLGYSILNYRDVTDYSSLMAIIVIIGILGYTSDALLRVLQRKYAWVA